MQEGKDTEEYVAEEDFEYKEGKGWKDRFQDFVQGPYFVVMAIVLLSIIAFSLGRISGLQDKKEPVRVLNNINTSPPNPSPKLGEGSSAQINSGEVKGVSNLPMSDIGGQVVASKNSTKYHYPWCGGAKQIAPKNLITFNSIEEARAAGYLPASNCKGLK